MKITVSIRDSLLAEAKATAAEQRTTLSRLVEEALVLRLATSKKNTQKTQIKLPVFDGKSGLVPGLTGLSNRELLDAADGFNSQKSDEAI
jgi:hypothetical protein